MERAGRDAQRGEAAGERPTKHEEHAGVAGKLGCDAVEHVPSAAPRLHGCAKAGEDGRIGVRSHGPTLEHPPPVRDVEMREITVHLVAQRIRRFPRLRSGVDLHGAPEKKGQRDALHGVFEPPFVDQERALPAIHEHVAIRVVGGRLLGRV